MTTEAEQLQSLDDVLAGKEPPAAAVDTAKQDEKVDTGNTDEAAKASEAAKAAEEKAKADEEAAAKAKTTVADKGKQEPKEEWTKTAVLDERQKRQKAERENAELKQRLEAFEKTQQGKKADFFADPDTALAEASKQISQQFSSKLHETRMEMSQEMMREKFADYDELEKEFIEMATSNPVLIDELTKARHPAKYAYETAMKAREAAALKDVDKVRADLEAKVRSEIEEKVRREIEEKAKKEAEKRNAAGGPSLSSARGKGSANTQGDDSLDNILKDRKKR